MNNGTYAKRLLKHYFRLLADRTGERLDPDCYAEMEGIVDDTIDAATAAAKEALEPRIAELEKEIASLRRMVASLPEEAQLAIDATK